MTTCDGRTGREPDVVPAAQHLRQELHRQHVARPAHKVDRDDGPPTHRIDIGESVGRRDPPPVVGVVDNRGEEVSGADDREPVLDADDGGVVAVLQPYEQIRRRHHR